MPSASFVPPPPVRELRDLTRARSTATAYRAPELQRLEKYLESTASKLSSVVSDLDGVTSTLILHALVGGERDPKALAALDIQITAAFEPFRTDIMLLSTIPGVKTAIAQVIIAETGGDMAAFPSSPQLASWAGVAPGNNESAGRHKPVATRTGDKYLKAAVGRPR